MAIEPMFQEIARSFATADFEAVAARVAFPLKFRVADKTLPVPNADALISTLQAYRKNLSVETYDHTDVVVTYESEPVEGRVQCLSRWTNFNERGAVISEVEIHSVCVRSEAGGWQIASHEIMAPYTTRLTDGITLI